MKLTAEIAGEKHELDIKQDGSRVTAEIDGRVYELEASAPRPGVYLLLAGGRVYECRVDHAGTNREAAEVTIGRDTYAVMLADPKRLRGAQTAGAQAHGTSEIVAPMPGKVVRVLVEAGEEVEAGAGVVVVEAMKMQNEMKSPKAGKVAVVNVREGATVNAGDVLAVVE
ncbi:MAG TPA: biotin/lipoyl-containing protein [Pyrinomonadaceae bacterium]|jgi:biotin carboxyl carrier protein